MAVMCFENTVGRLMAITYFVSVLISFFVVIPVGITLRNFQGSCILFAQFVWDGRTIWPYSEPCCDFILYMHLAATLLYAFWMGIYSLWVHIPSRFPFLRHHASQLKSIESHDEKFRIHSVNPVFTVINTIIMFMVMSAAIVITVGLNKFCNWGIAGVGQLGYTDINSCQGLQDGLDWSEFRIIRGETMGVKGGSFYISMGIATVASWLLFLVWLFQVVLNLSQSFTMCSCDVAEEKRKPDQAMLIAARRSRLSTPIHTPGGRYTPPVAGPSTGPMRPYAFRPPPGTQYTRPEGSQSRPQGSQSSYAPQQQPYASRPQGSQSSYAPQQQPYVSRPQGSQSSYAPQQQPHGQQKGPHMQQQQPYMQRPPPRPEPMKMQQDYVPPRR